MTQSVSVLRLGGVTSGCFFWGYESQTEQRLGDVLQNNSVVYVRRTDLVSQLFVICKFPDIFRYNLQQISPIITHKSVKPGSADFLCPFIPSGDSAVELRKKRSTSHGSV
ncbi:hypothetical protein JOB18_013287 [Solea senegalensis]|uniref:Uncharacterized protein n=1 Tax=Solea senegalensis TaxID=28829 RepID=A0AAV6R9I0_SOLSE|nr:hypothetical protein JOB18_013287 [Solea senegalensis]